MAKFLSSYGVGCRKEVTSQGCKMQEKQDADLGIRDDRYIYGENISGDEAV